MKTRLLLLITFLTALFFISSIDLYSGPRNIVMEFSTGTWCGFCPCGEAVADSILNVYPNTVIIGYHSGGNDPFVNAEATAVFSLIGYGASPTLCLDRMNHPGDPNHPYVPYSTWSNLFYQRYLSSPTTLIDVVVTSKTYNTSTRVLNVTINSTALQNLTGQYKVHFLITEDYVVYPQNFYSTCGYEGYHNDYVHKWIPRTVINGATGQTLNTGGVWNQNQSISKSFSYTLNNAWIANNCKFIAIVFRDSSEGLFVSKIQQALQQPVTDAVGITNENNVPSDYNLSQNYPNPFNPTTNIKFSIPINGNVSLKIYDILGIEKAVYMEGYLKAGSYNAEIDASSWASGVYYYQLTSSDFSETKRMILIK
jgi:hypothetical protein